MKICVSYPVDVCYGFGLSLNPLASFVFLLVNRFDDFHSINRINIPPLILICLTTYFFFEMMTYLLVTPIIFLFCMADTTFALKRSEESGA